MAKVRNASCKEECRSILQNVAFKINTSRMSLEIPMQKVFFMIFTTHPYAPLGVGNLADEIGVLHTNPRLYYIQNKNIRIL
jgi:hypothetical protein